MKRNSFPFLLVLPFLMIGCGNPGGVPPHEHTFSEDWSHDNEYHWHAATCEHIEEVSDKELHTFNEWVVDDEPAVGHDGHRYRECSVCHFVEEEVMDQLDKELHSLTFGVSSLPAANESAALPEMRYERQDIELAAVRWEKLNDTVWETYSETTFAPNATYAIVFTATIISEHCVFADDFECLYSENPASLIASEANIRTYRYEFPRVPGVVVNSFKFTVPTLAEVGAPITLEGLTLDDDIGTIEGYWTTGPQYGADSSWHEPEEDTFIEGNSYRWNIKVTLNENCDFAEGASYIGGYYRLPGKSYFTDYIPFEFDESNPKVVISTRQFSAIANKCISAVYLTEYHGPRDEVKPTVTEYLIKNVSTGTSPTGSNGSFAYINKSRYEVYENEEWKQLTSYDKFELNKRYRAVFEFNNTYHSDKYYYKDTTTFLMMGKEPTTVTFGEGDEYYGRIKTVTITYEYPIVTETKKIMSLDFIGVNIEPVAGKKYNEIDVGAGLSITNPHITISNYFYWKEANKSGNFYGTFESGKYYLIEFEIYPDIDNDYFVAGANVTCTYNGASYDASINTRFDYRGQYVTDANQRIVIHLGYFQCP